MTNGQSPFPFAQQDQRGKGDASFPSMDIVDTVAEVQFLIYLPGYRKQDVHILSYGDYLVVKGQRFSYFNEQDFRQKKGNTEVLKRKFRFPIIFMER